MIRFVPHAEPVQILIWGSAGLLSVVLGAGLSFFLWLRLHETAPSALLPAIAVIGVGLLVVGLGAGRRFEGALLALFAVSLILSFLVGSPLFPRLG